MTKTKQRFNWEILSLTRFILAFIVVSAHACTIFPNSLGPLEFIKHFGAFEAVLGFLLISGLSIGKSILRNPSDYFARRVQRIYPVYIATIIICLFLKHVNFDLKLLFTLIVNVFFLNQVFTNTSFIGPGWTLALEVWLYCLAPLFLKLSYKTLIKLSYFSLGCFAMYTCFRSLFHLPYYAGTAFGINIFLLSFIWIGGFTLARFTGNHKKNAINIAILFASHLVLRHSIQLAFSIKNHRLGLWVSNDILEIVCSVICLSISYYVVIFNDKIPAPSIKWKTVFNTLGNISYPLYLVHASLLAFCLELNITNWFILSVICIGVAWLIYYLFDFYSKKREAKLPAIQMIEGNLLKEREPANS